MNDFEKSVFNSLIPNYDSYVRCWDCNEQVTNFKAKRGKGGVAIIWPKCWSHLVKRLEEGNERIIGIELKTKDEPLYIINCYMPTNDGKSKSDYQKHIDILHSLIDKYSLRGTVILVGDMNGTLLSNRKNPHDVILKDFVNEHGLSWRQEDMGTESTFVSHTGNGNSQIDYILSTTKDILNSVKVEEKHHLNQSAHTVISSTLSVSMETLHSDKHKKSQPKTVTKLMWDKIDTESYQSYLTKEFETLHGDQCWDSEEQLKIISDSLNLAARKAVPGRTVKLQGPRFRASNEVKALLKDCKSTHATWKANGSPGPNSVYYVERKTAKKNLRRQIRRENFNCKERFYNNLMENPDSKAFHRLIRMNQNDRSNSSTCFLVNGESIMDLSKQRQTLKSYYEDLAVPKDDINFDDKYLEECESYTELIYQLKHMKDNDITELFTDSEIESCIKQLNSGKSADEFGLCAEHLKAAGGVLIPVLKNIFNDTLRSGKIPEYFRGGVLTPVPKSGKDNRLLDNYRGITVTSIIGKLFEKLISLRLLEKVNSNQSDLQFGFTKNLSPIMSALICSEAINEAKLEGKPLYLVTIDTRKAFDVVNHVILKKTLFDEGVAPDLWSVVDNLYSDMSSKIKWHGQLSEKFSIQQGVRQGSILSPHLYKMYVNPLLEELKRSAIGAHIGTIYVGTLAVADDFLFLSNCPDELQVMLNLSGSFSGERRYNIHPTKTTLVSRISTRLSRGEDINRQWFIGESIIGQKTETEHLGIIRSEKDENKLNINKRISLARRTLYALIKTGVHGCNGINPKTSFKIYQVYVLPRLLYGLEVLSLNKKQLDELEKFHLETLKNIQSLPTRINCQLCYIFIIGRPPTES